MNDWELLNLGPELCSKEKLKKAFTKLAFAHHPDFGGDEKKFIQIKDAYDRLLKFIDPNSVNDSNKILEEFIRELTERYNQAFPWRASGAYMIAENADYSREFIRRDRYLRGYLEGLAKSELANINRLRIES